MQCHGSDSVGAMTVWEGNEPREQAARLKFKPSAVFGAMLCSMLCMRHDRGCQVPAWQAWQPAPCAGRIGEYVTPACLSLDVQVHV